MQQVSTNRHHQYGYCRDGYIGYRIKSLMFDKPLPLNEAIEEIHSDKRMVEEMSCYKYFNNKILNQIRSDLLHADKSIRDRKVNGMIDYGQTAYVFETENGDILKITSRDHFLGRKSTDLDIPIKSHQKLSPESFCHYYLEEKTSNDITSKDIELCEKQADKLGYKIVDKRYDQFGKTKEGKVVIIDPECIRKKGAFGLLNYKFNKLKSYAKIILK